MPIAAVAFDMDGLMFNSESLYEQVGDELLRRRGHRVSRELLNRMMGRPAAVALQAMIDFHRLDATIEQLQAETEAIFPAIVAEQLQTMDGLLPLLDALESASVPKAVCTSSRRIYADQKLRMFSLIDRFDFVLTGEDVEQGKPHPEIYRTAASRWQLPASQMMVLEDSEIGCRAAVASGAFAVAVPGPHSAHHEFPGAQFVANTLRDPRIYEAFSER
ncbi:MAG: HAD family phosphatase [Planctomycetales bacterium]|nr:HAD family phosphatase [Planctomycetales bacterium]